jgi:hypothetical protein
MNSCDGRCECTAPHNQHLFLGVGNKPYAMRLDREGATVFLPSGQLIWRRNPGAIQSLKADVKHWEQGRA